MPTNNQSDDEKLTQLLQQAEPPRSPKHLDEVIIRQARIKASELREKSESVFSNWYGDNWKSVVGVFSVALIAVSVSLQIFDPNLREPGSLTGIGSEQNASFESSAIVPLATPLETLLYFIHRTK